MRLYLGLFVGVLVGGKQESELLVQGNPPIKEPRDHAVQKRGQGDVEANEGKQSIQFYSRSIQDIMIQDSGLSSHCI